MSIITSLRHQKPVECQDKKTHKNSVPKYKLKCLQIDFLANTFSVRCRNSFALFLRDRRTISVIFYACL